MPVLSSKPSLQVWNYNTSGSCLETDCTRPWNAESMDSWSRLGSLNFEVQSPPDIYKRSLELTQFSENEVNLHDILHHSVALAFQITKISFYCIHPRKPFAV